MTAMTMRCLALYKNDILPMSYVIYMYQYILKQQNIYFLHARDSFMTPPGTGFCPNSKPALSVNCIIKKGRTTYCIMMRKEYLQQ